MDKNNHILTQECLQFFSKMSASISHELKNHLAVINESAGLLKDFCLISEGSSPAPLPRERILSISEKMMSRVKQADETVKNLNRFAHSADKDVEAIDLEMALRNVLTLSSRLIDMKAVTINISPPSQRVMITANLFYFETILWQSVEMACSLAGDSALITIEIENRPAPAVWFSCKIKKITENKKKVGLVNSQLCDFLNISIDYNNIKENRFGLVWPEKKQLYQSS